MASIAPVNCCRQSAFGVGLRRGVRRLHHLARRLFHRRRRVHQRLGSVRILHRRRLGRRHRNVVDRRQPFDARRRCHPFHRPPPIRRRGPELLDHQRPERRIALAQLLQKLVLGGRIRTAQLSQLGHDGLHLLRVRPTGRRGRQQVLAVERAGSGVFRTTGPGLRVDHPDDAQPESHKPMRTNAMVDGNRDMVF